MNQPTWENMNHPLTASIPRNVSDMSDNDTAEAPDVDFAGNPIDRPAMLAAIAAIDWSQTPN